MARPVNTIKAINATQLLWKIAVRITDIWSVKTRQRQEHLEMVFMDACGDKIQVICPANEVKTWMPKLKDQATYIFENFLVYPNDFQFKLCDHPFKLVLCSGTLGREKDLPEIPPTTYNFLKFQDILNQNFKQDMLVDIIGGVQPKIINQMDKTPKKIVLSLIDPSNNIVSCTLWETTAQKFLTLYDKVKDQDKVVIILTHARIKPGTGAYPASISSSWFGCKMLVNDDVEEINKFKDSLLDVDLGNTTSQLSSQISTQMSTPWSANSQYTHMDKFFFKAKYLTLKDIKALKEDTWCITVGTIGKLLPNGWSYDACTACPKGTKITNAPFLCQGCGHSCSKAIPRYKIEIEVLQGKDSCTLLFWDNHIKVLLNVSAEALWDEMVKDGETERKCFPQKLDNLLGLSMAMRVRAQPEQNKINLSRIETDHDIMSIVLKEIEPQEHSLKEVVKNTKLEITLERDAVEATSSKATDAISSPKMSDQEKKFMNLSQFPPIDLSATSENDPEFVNTITPNKRLFSESVFEDTNLHDQMSTNKMKKTIKTEERPSRQKTVVLNSQKKLYKS